MMRAARLLTSMLLLPLARAAVLELTDDASFEERVMNEEGCWAVLFTATTRPDESTAALRQWELVEAANPAISFGTADVDAVRAVVSEFNIRKRMIPRILVFNSRARQAEFIKLATEPLSTEALGDAVRGFFAENPTKADGGDCLKTTLAIDSGGGDKAEL